MGTELCKMSIIKSHGYDVRIGTGLIKCIVNPGDKIILPTEEIYLHRIAPARTECRTDENIIGEDFYEHICRTQSGNRNWYGAEAGSVTRCSNRCASGRRRRGDFTL